MNADATSKERASGEMPPSGQPRTNLSEQELLAQAAREARIAMTCAWEDAKAGLGEAADLRLWTQQHPWVTLGVAAAAGFTAATGLVPSARAQSSAAEGTNGTAPAKAEKAEAAASAEPPSSLAAMLFDLAKVAVQTTLMAAIRGNPPGWQDPTPEQAASCSAPRATTLQDA
jgi:hypothetical protein